MTRLYRTIVNKQELNKYKRLNLIYNSAVCSENFQIIYRLDTALTSNVFVILINMNELAVQLNIQISQVLPQIWDEVEDFIPACSAVHQRIIQWKIINIGSLLFAKVILNIKRAHLYVPRCRFVIIQLLTVEWIGLS